MEMLNKHFWPNRGIALGLLLCLDSRRCPGLSRLEEAD